MDTFRGKWDEAKLLKEEPQWLKGEDFGKDETSLSCSSARVNSRPEFPREISGEGEIQVPMFTFFV